MTIDVLPGDAWALRRCVDDIRATLADIATARRAAERLDQIRDGVHWQGSAFDAYKVATERKPLPEALDRATSRMREAADQLAWFADRFDENSEVIAWCRSRMTAGELDPDEVARIEWEADEALRSHRAALATVAATFDGLDDETTFATPPPSNFDKVTGSLGDVVGGFGEACVELGKLGYQMALFTFPVTAPFKLHELWGHRDEAMAVARFAWEHPGEFGTEIGKAMIDFDTWTEDGVARWVGKRIPDIVLTLATAGVGTAIPALGDDLARVAKSFSRLVNRLPTPVEDLLLRLPAIEQLASRSHAATARFLAGDVVDFNAATRSSLAAIIGIEAVNRISSPIGTYRALADASEGDE